MPPYPRLRMRLRLTPVDADAAHPSLPPVDRSDAPGLGALLVAAYRDTPDDEGETVDDAIAEVERTLTGAYGPFLDGSSFVAKDGERLVGASLLTLWSGAPLVAHVVVDPDERRRGVGSALIRASSASLAAAGHRTLDLFVTEANGPAVGLYRHLGFEAIERLERDTSRSARISDGRRGAGRSP